MGYMYETKIKLMKGVYRFIKFEIRILLMTLNNKTKLLIKENSKQMELARYVYFTFKFSLILSHGSLLQLPHLSGE